MVGEKVSLDREAIQFHIKGAVREVLADAEQVRLVVTSIQAEVGQMFADCSVDELRRVAAVIRTHTVGLMLTAARIAGRAERLHVIADLRTFISDPPGEPAS